jgi:hypothetical protein
MATLIQIYNARRSNELKARTESALLVASGDVQNEDPGITNHAERLAMANACLSNEAYLQECLNLTMYSVATNANIAADPDAATDNDIQFVVNSQYTNIALNNPPS